MTSAEVLADAFGRIRDVVHRVLDGLNPDQLAARLDSDANSIGWLIWHLTRIQDDHIAGVAGTEQVWISGGWVERFGLPLELADHGYRAYVGSGCVRHRRRPNHSASTTTRSTRRPSRTSRASRTRTSIASWTIVGIRR